ncbi:cytochrome B [Mucilaginibacter segetis]|uniref:Cytochrome B n=1 Tax=Mucilaginibacter segetis TaxID=2793071 RepID=A0A934PU94_9SPHI|nr:cytochrome B [Mucilaginibacter segetis]MBK0380159.1 cytochrome B [Mucilaginibacter segetis]
MNAYSFFLYFHSGFRYIVLILVLLAIFQSFAGWLSKKQYTNGNRKINLFAMISAHTQLLLGIILYFLSPFVQFTSTTMKQTDTRYWTVEHAAMMIFAIILITVGHSRSKKIILPEGKHRAIAIFYSLALLVIVLAIVQSQRPFFGVSH